MARRDADDPKMEARRRPRRKGFTWWIRPDSVQDQIAMATSRLIAAILIIRRWMVLNQIFGQVRRAGFFLNLRENKGYTYGVYKLIHRAKVCRPWRAGGDVRTSVTDGAMTDIPEWNQLASRDQKVADAGPR